MKLYKLFAMHLIALSGMLLMIYAEPLANYVCLLLNK